MSDCLIANIKFWHAARPEPPAALAWFTWNCQVRTKTGSGISARPLDGA
jgi:hypothetical protein